MSVRAIAAQLGLSPTTVQTKRQTLRSAYQTLIAHPYPIPKDVLHVISWSGGKDSSALLVWALQHLPQDQTRYIFCDTGWEAPETYRFIEEVNRRLLGDSLIVLRSSKYKDLLDLSRKRNRFPSTKARFCTEELKIIPMTEWILQQQCDVAVYQGIRAQESLIRSRLRPTDDYFIEHIRYDQDPYTWVNGERRRRHTPAYQKRVMAWLDNYDCTVHRPFFHWKKADVLALCRQHNVLNPLYDSGFDRVGCFPCIMESRRGIRAIATLAPERIDLIAQVEQETGHTFFPSTPKFLTVNAANLRFGML